MKKFLSLMLLLGIFSLVPAFSNQAAKANLMNTMGETIGQASFIQNEQGVVIKTHLSNIPEGLHAFHIHTIGNCIPPSFTSAGGHYNPQGKEHGYQNPKGSHVGDLPNVLVGKDGILDSEILLKGATLKELFDKDGSALVLHELKDDYKTDPSGNAGDRIACGIIQE